MEDPECVALKGKWDKCFNLWYFGRFRKGRLDGLEFCTEFFEDWKDCVTEKIGDQVLAKQALEAEQMRLDAALQQQREASASATTATTAAPAGAAGERGR